MKGFCQMLAQGMIPYSLLISFGIASTNTVMLRFVDCMMIGQGEQGDCSFDLVNFIWEKEDHSQRLCIAPTSLVDL